MGSERGIMDFKTAIKEGKVVVVAGAGISKDPPSNLPSWWDYNYILLESIGKLGAQCIGQDDNLLNVDQLINKLSVVSISEFVENRIAGKSYYPLLSLLDGAKPNTNHYMLADLAQSKSICAIITTNFDTLLETAFKQKGVLYNSFDAISDYYIDNQSSKFPIYKIHGSANNTDFAIDTVHQKLKGLSVEKREVMKKLFTNCHVLFIGFSGQDFLFGSDYIPIQANREGVTWLAHPGSRFNKYTKDILDSLDVNVIETTLLDFYNKNNWSVTSAVDQRVGETDSFHKIAERAIIGLLESSHIGEAACLGLCLNLLEDVEETDEADTLYGLTESYLFNKKEMNMIEGLKHISLLTAMASHAVKYKDYEKARFYCVLQVRIFEEQEKFIKEIGDNIAAFRERSLNKSTVMNNIGQIYTYENNYSKALECFASTFHLAYQAMSWENMAYALFNIGNIKAYLWEKERLFNKNVLPKFFVFFECAKRVAEHGGYAQIQFDVNSELVKYYSMFGQRELMEGALKKINQLQILSTKNSINQKEALRIQQYRKEFKELSPWPKDHFPLCEPYDHVHIWHPFGQRPVLSCPEGIKAKSIYESGQYMTCLDYLSTAINKNIEDKQYMVADMLLDVSVGIMLDLSNKAALIDDMHTHEVFLKRAQECLEQCVKLEIDLLRIDYLAETLGTLSKVNYLLSQDSVVDDFTCFQAELTLCFSSDPTECWQSMQAMEVAAYINNSKGRTIPARHYCEMYLDMADKYPNVTDPINIGLIRKLYKSIL